MLSFSRTVSSLYVISNTKWREEIKNTKIENTNAKITAESFDHNKHATTVSTKKIYNNGFSLTMCK